MSMWAAGPMNLVSQNRVVNLVSATTQHDLPAAPQTEIHLQLLGALVDDTALDRVFLALGKNTSLSLAASPGQPVAALPNCRAHTTQWRA